MDTLKTNYKNFYYPPGGILMWIIIYLELLTFGMAMIAFVYYGNDNKVLFHQSRMELNTIFGVMNTVFLLTSGFFMAHAVLQYKEKEMEKSSFFFKLAMLGGLFFLGLKSVEYYQKIESGISLDTNLFYTFYWLLTGFHVIHVIVGLVILCWTNYSMTMKYSSTTVEDVEASAVFWHLCDLIWVLLFPLLYLLF